MTPKDAAAIRRAASRYPDGLRLSDSALHSGISRKRDRQRKLRSYARGFVALLAIITLCAAFYAVYAVEIQEMIRL